MDVMAVAMALSVPDGLPDATIRVVLTGDGGGCYDVALSPSAPASWAALVSTDVVALCRVAGRRLDPTDLPAELEGDVELGTQLLQSVGAFARD
jgi:hypothetical protein